MVPVLILLTACLRGGAAAENWPGFRGPTGLGLTKERDLAIRWGGDDAIHVLWKSPLVGEGHASPIVWEERVFVCTARWPSSVEDRKKVIPEHHLLCYGTEGGKLRWDTRIPAGPWLRTDFRSGPGGGYAAPTPATDGRHVFCAFGSSVMAAVDFEGRIVWRREILPHTFDVTLGSSPVLHGDTVILLCAMARESDSRVLALKKGSGEVAWQKKLPSMGFGHSTPLFINVEGRRQMLVLASAMKETPDALRSLDPDTGKVLWWCRGAGDASTPSFGGGLVYFDSGRGSPGVCVDPGGKGDVTDSRVRWRIPVVPEGIGSPTILDGLVYRLHSPCILKCWELETGRRVYQQRLSDITTTWASPVADPQGRIFFASAGTSVVIRAGREFELLSVNRLGDENHASPAVSGGRMFLAGTDFLHCIGQD